MTRNRLGKQLEKKPIEENEKKSKNRTQNARCEQKPTARKHFLSNRRFFRFKSRVKKFHAAKFRSTSNFGVAESLLQLKHKNLKKR